MASSIRFSDLSNANQLLRGFFDLQAGTWRWAGPRFAVQLGTPAGGATRGARLVLDFNLPESSIAALKTVTVTAKIGGLLLPPQTYSTAGAHRYEADVPASAVVPQQVTVEFSVDKSLTPPNDSRKLALIVTAISLEPK